MPRWSGGDTARDAQTPQNTPFLDKRIAHEVCVYCVFKKQTKIHWMDRPGAVTGNRHCFIMQMEGEKKMKGRDDRGGGRAGGG